MANRHIYFAVENLALSDEDRAILLAELSSLGVHGTPRAHENNHERVRLDSDAAIYESLWNEDNITVQKFKDRLAVIFSVDVGTITHAVQQVTFDVRQTAVVTFTRGVTDYLRVAFFGYAGGGDWPSKEQSNEEAIAYLFANAAAWGDVED